MEIMNVLMQFKFEVIHLRYYLIAAHEVNWPSLYSYAAVASWFLRSRSPQVCFAGEPTALTGGSALQKEGESEMQRKRKKQE